MAPRIGMIDDQTGAVLGPGGEGLYIDPRLQSTDPRPAGTEYVPQAASDGFAEPTGWAGQQGYVPEMLESIYQNPWFLLQDVFQGINTSSPGYQALRDFGADPLSLYTIMQGANSLTQNQDGGAASGFANFLQNLYSQLGTSGGQELSAREMIGNIFGQTEFGADAGSDLGRLLGSGDASTQIRTLFNLLRDVAGSAMNPLAASGYQAALAQAGDRYGNAMLRTSVGDQQKPGEWMNENVPNIAWRR